MWEFPGKYPANLEIVEFRKRTILPKSLEIAGEKSNVRKCVQCYSKVVLF